MTIHPALEHDWFPRPLPDNVEIGERSRLWSAMAFLRSASRRPQAVRIGHDTGVYWGTFFDLGPDGEVRIGDFCTIVSPVFALDGAVEIGDHVFISYDVVIADTGAAVPPDARDGGPRHGPAPEPTIVIGDEAWVGVRSILLPGARLGRGAIVGAATVVDFEIPPYAVVGGNPARLIGWAPPGCGARSRGG